MILADIGSVPWKVLFLLHILAVIVAFAPAFTNPFIASRMRKAGSPLDKEPNLVNTLVENSKTVHGPALVAVGLFGLGLVFSSGDQYKFSQTWVSTAFLLWVLMLGVLFGLLLPAERGLANGDAEMEKRVGMFGGILHLLLFLMLIDMIWKPFL